MDSIFKKPISVFSNKGTLLDKKETVAQRMNLQKIKLRYMTDAIRQGIEQFLFQVDKNLVLE